jgi:hypothetical protein
VNTPELTQVLNRPDVRDALQLAQRRLLNRGDALPDGLTVGLLDDVKKVLDRKVGAITKAAKTGSASGDDVSLLQSIRTARRALVDAVDDATGGAYRAARQTAAPRIREREAFREGAAALRQRGDQLTQRVAGQTPAEQALGLEGAATEIAERLTSRDPGRAASVLDTKARRNLDILTQQLPKAREAIQGTYDRASKLQQQARASTMRGQSTTASTLAGQEELMGTAGHLINAVDPGGALTFGPQAMAMRLLAKAYRANARARLGRGSEEVAAELADLFTRKLGDEVSQPTVLRLLQQAMSEQAIAKAAKTGRRVAAGALAGTAGSQFMR